MDETDIRIVDYLGRDGRASLRELAEELDLSPSTVSNRFHRLQESGALQGFQPKLDYEKFGFGLTAVIDVMVEAGAKEEIIPNLSEKKEIMSEFVVTGDTDIVLICKFLDREHMYDFLKDLQNVEGIGETRTNVALDCVKEYGSVDLKEVLGQD